MNAHWSRLRATRRSFLALIAKASFLFGLGALASLQRRRRYVRPPGAHSAEHFESLCIKCHVCEQICETGIITPLLLTDDIKAAGTPVLNFREGYCTLCLKCTEHCPTGALLPIAKEAVRLGVAKVNQSRCIAWVWTACTLCYAECPNHAIELDAQNRPVVREELCNGCGKCEYVCIAAKARSYVHGGGLGIIVVPLENGQVATCAHVS